MSKTYDYFTFKRQVDYAVQRKLGCGIYDLPDVIIFDDYWHNDCKKNADDFWNAVEAAIMMRTLHLFALLGEASACVAEWNEASPSSGGFVVRCLRNEYVVLKTVCRTV